MARPIKKGLHYYNADTNRYQDIKIKRLKKQFGCNGLCIWDYLLNEIYRVEGSYIEYNEHISFDVADYFDIDEVLIDMVVKYCCEIGLFNQEMFENYSILTSKAIQERYIKICKDARRSDINVCNNYSLIELLPEETTLTPEETELLQQNSAISTQRKEKKRKEKESKEDEKDSGNNYFDGNVPFLPIDQLFEKFKSSDELGFLISSKGIKTKLELLLTDYCAYLRAVGQTNKTEIDFRKHFLNWANKQPKKTVSSAQDYLNSL